MTGNPAEPVPATARSGSGSPFRFADPGRMPYTKYVVADPD